MRTAISAAAGELLSARHPTVDAVWPEAWGAWVRLLTLYSVLLHFLDLGDGLPQVVRELLAVLGVGGVEVDEDFDVCTWDG